MRGEEKAVRKRAEDRRPPPPKKPDAQKQFDQHTARLASVLTGVSKAALVWVAAILIICASSLRDVMREVEARILANKKAEYRLLVARDQKKKAAAGRPVQFESDVIGPLKIPAVIPLAAKRAFRIDSKKVAAKQTALEGAQKRESKAGDALGEDVKFPVFGLSIPVPPTLVPLALSVLLLGVVIYVHLARRLAHRQLVRAIAIARDKLRMEPEGYRGLVFTPPFWVLPLPRQTTPEIDPKDLLAALEWTDKARRWSWATFFSLIVAVCLQLYLMFCSIQVTMALPRSLLTGAGYVFSALALVATIWFASSLLGELLPEKARQWVHTGQGTKLITRRRLLAAAGTVLLTFGVVRVGVAVFKQKAKVALSPRKVKRKKRLFQQVKGSGRFVIGKKSKVIHYVNDAGFLMVNADMRRDRLKRVPLSKLPIISSDPEGRHIDFSTFAVALEAEALKKVKVRNYREAIRLLTIGIQHDMKRPQTSYRLYDLLALLAARHDPLHLEMLAEVCERSTTDKALLRRTHRWRDPKSQWSKRALEPGRVWGWTKSGFGPDRKDKYEEVSL